MIHLLRSLIFASFVLSSSVAIAQGARWEAGGGLQGTMVKSIVVGPDNARYAATDRGVYVWPTKRQSWVQLIGGATMRGAELLHWSANGELMATGDRLAMWDPVKLMWSTILDDPDASAIATTKRGDIILGKNSGPDPVTYSKDNGATWHSQGPWAGGLARISHFLVESDSIIWAVTANGLFKSTWGENWQLVSSEIKEGRLYRGPDGMLWANGANALMRSVDEGVTWSQRYTRKIVGLIQLGELTMVGTSQGVYKSSDFGETWQLSSMKNYSLTALECDSSGNGIAGTSISDVAATFFSSKGLFDWTWSSDIIQIRPIKAMARYGSIIVAAMSDEGRTSTAIIRSSSGGRTWEFTNSLEGRIHSLITTTHGTLYAAGDQGVSRSIDMGVSWTAINNDLYDLRTGGIFAIKYDTLLLTAHVAEVTLQGGPEKMPYGIYRSTNSGATWELFNDDKLKKQLAMGPITVTSDGWIYAAQAGGTGYYSSDHGQNWNEFSLPDEGAVEKFVPIGKGQLLMSLDSTSYILTRGTNELKKLDRKVEYVDANGGFWSMDDSSTHRSLDLGSNWSRFSEGLLQPMELTVMTEDATYYLLGGETGLYRLSKQSASVRTSYTSSRTTQLKVYPNPARDRVSIELADRSTTSASVRIINMIGQTVQTYSSLKPGQGQLEIALPNLPMGQYFLEVRSANGIETASLVIE